MGNPGLDVLDIPTVSAIAHEHGIPLLVDSTFTTLADAKPFEALARTHGHHSAWFSGHWHRDRRRGGGQRPV